MPKFGKFGKSIGRTQIRTKVAVKAAPNPNANRMMKGPSDKTKNAPIPASKKGRTAGPAERVGRKYGTKAGRAIDRGVAAIDSGIQSVGRSAQNAATRIKGRAMDLHGDLSNKKYSGYDLAKAGTAGAIGSGIGAYASSKWSEHKRQQRGY